MPQCDDYPNGAESVGRPCGGARAAAAVEQCPRGSWRRSGLWSAVRFKEPQTTTMNPEINCSAKIRESEFKNNKAILQQQKNNTIKN